jgi:hypothetical protein
MCSRAARPRTRAGGANAACTVRKADRHCAQLAADRHWRFGLFATLMLQGGTWYLTTSRCPAQ